MNVYYTIELVDDDHLFSIPDNLSSVALKGTRLNTRAQKRSPQAAVNAATKRWPSPSLQFSLFKPDGEVIGDGTQENPYVVGVKYKKLRRSNTSEKMLRSLVYDLACEFYPFIDDKKRQADLDTKLKKLGILDERGWSTLIEKSTGKTHIRIPHSRWPDCGCGPEIFGGTTRHVPRKDAEKYVTCKGCLAAMKKGKL